MIESGNYESLFKILSEEHPDSVVQLGIQYRMNEEIMSISNELVYNHRLVCGSKEVAKSRLNLLSLSKLPCPIPGNKHWLSHVLIAENTVLFLDLDSLPSHEMKQNRIITNRLEARITSIVRTVSYYV